MKRQIIVTSVLCACVFTTALMADIVPPEEPSCVNCVQPPPTLDEVVGDSPFVVNIAPLVGLTESGQSWVTLPGTGQTQAAVATILLEAAGFATQNKLGIYKNKGEGVAPLSSEKLLIFTGIDAVGATASVQFDLLTGNAWYDRNGNSIKDLGETANIGNTFGFYLISPDCGIGTNKLTFYTDVLLNPENQTIEHGLIYDTSSISGAIQGNPDVVVAFEDLLIYHADCDYDDMVVGITGVNPVPEPATVVLLGLGSLILLRKRSL